MSGNESSLVEINCSLLLQEAFKKYGKSPTVSIYDNVPDINIISTILNTQYCDSKKRFYCCFCNADYGFDFLFRNHVEKHHQTELLKAIDISTFQNCGFCAAKFYTEDIYVKHTLYHHQTNISHMFQLDEATAKIKCLFCLYTVNKHQTTLLLIHVERKHLQLFFESMKPKDDYVQSSQNKKCIEGTHNFEFVELQKFLDECKVKAFEKQLLSKKKRKSILKPGSSQSKEAVYQKPVARKTLRFQITEDKNKSKEGFQNPLKSLKLMNVLKPTRNFLMRDEKNKNFFKNLKNIKLPKNSGIEFINEDDKDEWSATNVQTSTPQSQPKEERKRKTKLVSKKLSPILKVAYVEEHLKCGRCWKCFPSNTQLVEHVKKCHKKFTLNVLQPNYLCGKCNVKFFSSNYLDRHCELQHTRDSLK